MAFHMKDNGKMECDRVQDNRYGQMEVDTSENGDKIKQMEKVFFTILIKIFMRVSGLMTRQMDMEFIRILMVQNMLDNGRMTNKMVLESSSGLMDKNMKVNTKVELKLAKEF